MNKFTLTLNTSQYSVKKNMQFLTQKTLTHPKKSKKKLKIQGYITIFKRL